jgi:hypothetical protein
MPLGPVLVLSAVALLSLLVTGKSSAAPANGKSPVKPEFKDIPQALLLEMARAVQMLTITDFETNPDGSIRSVDIVGPVTKEAVQNATALAAKLEAAGFAQAARTLRDLATLAAKRIPSPTPDKAVPLPAECFSAAEQDQLNRLIALERDPKILQGVLDALKKRSVPAHCRATVDNVINMLSALVVQIQARLAEEEALRKIEEELRKKGSVPGPTPSPTPGPSPSPLPGPTPGPSPAPLPPSPTSTRVTLVQSGDGFARIAARLLGSTQQGNLRWRELRDANVPKDADGRARSKDTDAKGGIKPILHPGQKLFVPASWPVVGPSIPVPGPTPSPLPSPVLPPAPTGVRKTKVQSGDGFARIAARLLGDTQQGNLRWRELRDRNVPVDADGRARSKDTDAKGGIKPILHPGQSLFVPESWPASSFAVAGSDEYVGDAGEGFGLVTKTQEEMAAESMVTHLNRLQRRHPVEVEKVQRKADKRLIARFQQLVGLPVTATVNAATLIKAAEQGQHELPLVLDWSGQTREHVDAYKSVLTNMANKSGSTTLLASVAREQGQTL